ncbi:MAG TPA: hypothetical protein VFQ67_03420 [Allosphingosinicella sp.]|jgi:hypothetical protein|nr:hypothetical protein [Allosphingosinicella sp.]
MPKLSFLSARAFDTGLAAVAAISAGFVAFAMPQPLFTGLVEASRLPDFVAAAQPPLGETARMAAAAAAALLTFAAVWALMAALGRAPARPKAEARPEAEADAPRLRRADAHPDAPARRPLLARDLGEPLELEDFPEAPSEPEPAFTEAEQRPLPAFLVPQFSEDEPVAEVEPEPHRSEPQWDEPETRWDAAEQDWPEAELEPEPQPEEEARQELPPISELAAQLAEGEEDPDQSLAQMVKRIEFGLSRKRQALPAGGELPPVEPSPGEQEKVGHRLRSAINDLQKIASSGG